jgi:hypothetical protein
MYSNIKNLFISNLSKHVEVIPATSQEYSRELMDLIWADEYEPQSTFHFANRTMLWVDKLRNLVHAANRMPRPPMNKERWITEFVSLLREKLIDFVPSVATRHLSAKRIKRIIHTVKQSHIQVVIPVRQGTQMAAPTGPKEQPCALLPHLGFRLSHIPPELIQEHQKEVERLESKPGEKSTVLMKLFTEAYETLNLSDPYHRILIAIGRILILSTPIPTAEPGTEPLHWGTSHNPNKDKHRWLYLFVIIGLHYVNPDIQTQTTEQKKKFIKPYFGLCYCNVS